MDSCAIFKESSLSVCFICYVHLSTFSFFSLSPCPFSQFLFEQIAIPTNILLQNLLSIQKRTSPIKFAHLAEKSEFARSRRLQVRLQTAKNQNFENLICFCRLKTTNCSVSDYIVHSDYSIYLQKSASIQQRTSLKKVA